VSDRVALVTGSTSGIGAATARRLARDGYKVALHSRSSADVGERMAGELAGASYHQADLADEQATRDLVAGVLKHHGRLDVLVNNAGIGSAGAAEENSVVQAQGVFDVNVFGLIRMTRAVLPHMRAQGSGRIINISSVLGFLPAPYGALYAASKHAVEGYFPRFAFI
jgi:NAD(P)-dependent dehydrogenase (short-subunit alcohol dehydrogenase family)